MAIDITKVLDLFNRADFRAIVNEYRQGDMFYKTFFPSLFQPTLTFESLEATTGLKVAGDVVAFNSRAPRKGRQTPASLKGTIPKIEIAKVKEETDINLYYQLQDIASRLSGSSASQVNDRLIEYMYGDSIAVLDGVNARLEWLAKRIASTGKVELTLTNNAAGYVTQVPVDFGITTTNGAVNWNTVATATPVADIRGRVNAGRAVGKILRFATTDQATFDRMVATSDMQKFTASFAQNALNLQQSPNLTTVNTALGNAGLPQFRIWDSYVSLEAKDGTRISTTGWEDGNIIFSELPTLGNTQNTLVADERVADESIKEKNDFILVKTWYDQDPLVQLTKGVAYAAPIINNSSDKYILKTIF